MKEVFLGNFSGLFLSYLYCHQHYNFSRLLFLNIYIFRFQFKMFVNLHITTKTCNSMAMYITYKTCNYTKCNEQNVILFTASFSKHGLCPMCASAGSFLSSLYSPPDRFSSPSSLLPPLAGTIYKKERKKEMREKTVTWTFLTFAIFSQRHFLNSLICL